MPSPLTLTIQSTISTLLKNSSSTDNAVDVLRRLRDESSRLYREQLVYDEFDCDPLGAFRDDDENDDGSGGNSPREFRDRVKSNLSIVNYSYDTTRDGHVDISCTIHFKTDDRTSNDVKDHVSLTFRYRRCPVSHHDADAGMRQQQGDDGEEEEGERGDDLINDATTGDDNEITKTAETVNGSHKRRKIMTTLAPATDNQSSSSPLPTDYKTCRRRGTNVSYTIDTGTDWGRTERLLMVEVMACGEGPSALEPRPLPCDDDDEEGDAALLATSGLRDDDDAGTNSNEIRDTDDDGDRYAAYVDPDVMTHFLTGMGATTVFDARSALLFLLTFPFYEHEWDLVHFVLDSVLVGCDEEEDGEGVEEEYDSGGELVT